MAQVEIIAANLKTDVKKSKKNQIQNVGAYARVSTDNEDQQTSYASQIQYYSEYITSNPNWKFAGIYADEGISGTQVKNRTEFQRMIEDACNGKLDIIIAKSISRFARNTLDTLKYVRLLRENNVDVYFEKENIHTLNLDSEIFLTLYSAFAQAESESTSLNVKMGVRAKMKRGEFTGKVECFGYTWDKAKKTLLINERQAKVIRQIYDWYIQGLGSSAIAKKLNELNLKTYFGKKWYGSAVVEIIKNEKYVGDLLGQKYYVESPLTHKRILNYGEKEKYYAKNTHEAIVSREVWNKAQEIFNKRSSLMIPNGRAHGRTGYSSMYPFSCKIICGICGHVFSRRTGSKRKDGTKNIYWACTEKMKSLNGGCENGLFIRNELLENIFVQLYNYLIKNKHNTKEKLLKVILDVLAEEKNYKVEIEKLKREEDTLKKRLSNLIDLKLDNCISKNDYIDKEKEIKEQLNVINNELEKLEKNQNDKNSSTKKIKSIEKIINESNELKTFDSEIFDSLVEKIIIGEIDEQGNKNFQRIKFVLKTGEKFSSNIDYTKPENHIFKSMSFSSELS